MIMLQNKKRKISVSCELGVCLFNIFFTKRVFVVKSLLKCLVEFE